MQNSIIIACALDDWEVADVYRRTADFVYDCEFKEAQRKQNAVALECLEEVREDVDEIAEARLGDLEFIVHTPEGFYMDPAEAYPGLMMTERDGEVQEHEEAGEQKVVSCGEKESEMGDEFVSLPMRAAPAIENATPDIARRGDE
jgi:hypothetical protein